MNTKKIFLMFFLMLSATVFSQGNNQTQTINASSFYTNYLEYNTGEIFVIYNFNTNFITSKNLVFQEEKEKNLEQFQIKIYPNPVTELLFYVLPDDFIFESVEIYDQFQKQVFTSNKDSKQISLKSLPTGTFYVIFNGNFAYNYKIIKL